MGVPTALRSLLAALVATAVAVGGGVAVVGSDPKAPPAEVPPVALADLDTTVLAAQRAGFCAVLTPDQVAAALGGEPAASTSYDNGERAEVAAGVADVAHEFGCSWTGADGGEARGWVFAPPVTADRAQRLARAAARAEGCRRLPDAPAYGAASVAVVCAADGTRVVSHRGLFGDAWLVCSLSAPATTSRAELVERADRWCAAVVISSTS